MTADGSGEQALWVSAKVECKGQWEPLWLGGKRTLDVIMPVSDERIVVGGEMVGIDHRERKVWRISVA